LMEETEAKNFIPRIVYVNEQNRILE
jgi:aspartate 1-decarboxylase